MPNLREQFLRLLQDPRIAKLLQDERVRRALMEALRARGRIGAEFDERVDRLARALNLATKREVRELKRTVRRLEEELRRGRTPAPEPTNGYPNAPS